MATPASNPSNLGVFDPEKKELAFITLGALSNAIVKAAGITDVMDYYNLDASYRLEGAVATLYNTMRKKAHNNLVDEQKVYARSAQLWGVHAAKLSTSIAEFKKEHPQDPDWMITTPIVNMHTVSKLVKDEVRVGVTQLIPKKGQKDKPVSISTYGLSAVHAPYLKYITMQPERRSGLMMCIGPLALAINLLEDKKYQDKTKRALKESIKHLAMADAIIECLCLNNKSTIGNVLSMLGDVLLLTTDRSHQKMTPPLMTVLNHYSTVDISSGLTNLEAKKYSKSFDFSGKGAAVFYRDAIAGKKFKWTTDDTIASNSSQVFFHECFSTHVEDLGILGQITNITQWKQRKDLSKVFTRSPSATVVEFTAAQMKYNSKLANACGTKMLGTVEPMLQAKPIFSGKRKRCFSDELIKVLKGSRTGAFSSDVASVTKALADTKEFLLDNPLSTEYGTTPWYETKDITVDAWGTPSVFEATETGKYFYA